MQADIFNTRVVKLENEQGPAMGAAMLAAFGSGWFDSLEECAEQFIHEAAAFYPKNKMFKHIKHYSSCIRTFTFTQKISIQL